MNKNFLVLVFLLFSSAALAGEYDGLEEALVLMYFVIPVLGIESLVIAVMGILKKFRSSKAVAWTYAVVGLTVLIGVFSIFSYLDKVSFDRDIGLLIKGVFLSGSLAVVLPFVQYKIINKNN